MISAVITILLSALIVAVVLQPNRTRLAIALVFVVVTWLGEIFLRDLDGLAYYGNAALWDLGIIILISAIRPITHTALTIQKVCLASIYMNTIGYVLWFWYHPPLVYELGFVVIYAWALLTLLKGSSVDVGLGGANRRDTDIPGNLYTRMGFILRHKSQA